MAFYDAIPASDGTSLNAPSNAEFKVFEVSDTARANPLELRTVAGTNAAPLVTTAQGVVPPVEVASPNFEHIFKSGEWEWRRESSEGIKRAATEAQIAATEAQASAAEAVSLVKKPTDEAVDEGIARADIPRTVAEAVAATNDRVKREALADRIFAWLSTEIENDRGDYNLMALLRRLRLRKTSASATSLLAVDAADEQPQSTGAGLALQFVAEMARTFPEKSEAAKPIAARIAETLIAMQCQDPKQPYHGGVMAAPGSILYSALGAGQAIKGLLAAYEVWGVGRWLESAKLGGTFLRTLINPNPVYMSLYGHNVIEPGPGAAIICDRMAQSGQLSVTSSAWNLVGIHALYRLSDVTGDESYRAAAKPVRDFMATTLTNYYDYYATKATAEALLAGTATENFPLESTSPRGTNAFQRRGDANATGTIESDSMEYALTALWHTGYDLAAIKKAYEHLSSLVQLSTAGTAAFRAEYDSVGRLTCWPGYFRIQYQGSNWAYGGYYDSQGAGELLAFKRAYYPEHYEMSFDIIRAIIEPDRGALLTTNYETLWTDNGDGTVYAIQGVIPIAVAGLGLLETTDSTNMEVSA